MAMAIPESKALIGLYLHASIARSYYTSSTSICSNWREERFVASHSLLNSSSQFPATRLFGLVLEEPLAPNVLVLCTHLFLVYFYPETGRCNFHFAQLTR
jgi:hypothetical protein